MFILYDEMQKYNSTAFIELQYCKKKYHKLKFLNKYSHWCYDSLYIYNDDIENFLLNYQEIFNNISYSSSNYFSKEQTINIIKKIETSKPKDYKILLDWLKEVSKYHGFYLLGI